MLINSQYENVIFGFGKLSHLKCDKATKKSRENVKKSVLKIKLVIRRHLQACNQDKILWEGGN